MTRKTWLQNHWKRARERKKNHHNIVKYCFCEARNIRKHAHMFSAGCCLIHTLFLFLPLTLPFLANSLISVATVWHSIVTILLSGQNDRFLYEMQKTEKILLKIIQGELFLRHHFQQIYFYRCVARFSRLLQFRFSFTILASV